jgi:hypothetical protein
LVRTDLPVPVYHAITETDIEVLSIGTNARQADTPTFRYYEVAGGGHLTVHEDVEILPADTVGPDPLFLEDLCRNQINSTADGPIFFGYIANALWDAMEKQVIHGRVPPAGLQMEVDTTTGDVLRDEFGNGLGGVRLPAMEVPTATYTPGNEADPELPGFLQALGNLACRLASSVDPFDAELIDELYPQIGSYLSKVMHAANHLQQEGLLLNKDRQKIVQTALKSPAACGLGFEIALILPPIMWLRGRRRRRA